MAKSPTATGKAAPATKASAARKPAPRNLVVCCDGTSNEIGTKLSNVLKLYKIAEKSDDQVAYYSPGIGTIAMPDTWGKWRGEASSLFEMATGYGLDRDVLEAYCFLCRHYREGDRVFLFGFSRGAYTVRVLAGMIYLVGLLREDQVNFATYALKAYKGSMEQDEFATAREFRDVVRTRYIAIDFLGVWDTVASVIVPGSTPLSDPTLEELPFTQHNPAVRVFRHAIAIDEFRRMFRLTPWTEPQIFKPNPHSQEKVVGTQDIRQVWFAGCHSDVGGGFPENESALSKFPLIWMLAQAKAHGLLLRTAMVNHIAYGKPRKGARDYMKPDPAGKLHNSLTSFWRALEYIPKPKKYLEWRQRRTVLGQYIPNAEPRVIADGALVHVSVKQRQQLVRGYKPVNLPQVTATETLTGPAKPAAPPKALKAGSPGSSPDGSPSP